METLRQNHGQTKTQEEREALIQVPQVWDGLHLQPQTEGEKLRRVRSG